MPNLINSRDDLHAGSVAVTFTSFAGGKDLSGADAPRNAQHLPCAVTVQVGAAAQHLDFTDVNGTANVMTFPAVGTFHLPHVAPAAILAASTVAGLTVWWQVRVNAKV
jgi:hypothetical protein